MLISYTQCLPMHVFHRGRLPMTTLQQFVAACCGAPQSTQSGRWDQAETGSGLPVSVVGAV